MSRSECARVGDGTGRAAGREVRRHDLALVLGEVVAAEPVSRAAIAGRTGLTRGTVSSLVQELLDAELLTERDATRAGPGRPANPLQLNRSGPAGLGVPVGAELSALLDDLPVRCGGAGTDGGDARPPAPPLTRLARGPLALSPRHGRTQTPTRGVVGQSASAGLALRT